MSRMNPTPTTGLGGTGPSAFSATGAGARNAPPMAKPDPYAAGASGGGLVTPTMDVRAAVASYFDRIISSISGMKAVLLDDDTKRVVSMVYTQSQILEKSVFLTASLLPPPDKPDNPQSFEREKMMHLKGVIICRPVRSSIDAVLKEIKDPMYGEYHIFFTNTLHQDALRDMAEADRGHVVRQVQEFYADYLAINKDLFDFDLKGVLRLSKNRGRWTRDDEDLLFRRSIKGLVAVLLSLRQKPTIRFTNGSDLCALFARELKHEMEKDRSLFDFGAINQTHETLLLILDRRDDPVTPILMQWTYQAMVHELLTIRDNVVDMSQAPGVEKDKDLQRVVLAQSSDEFFRDNMFRDYGALAENAKRLLDQYKDKFDRSRQLKTIEDMQSFMEDFPEFKKLATNASKHVAVVSELSRQIEKHRLLDVSALEQDLACTNDHSSHLERVKQKLMDSDIAAKNKLYLVLLYALRYETHGGNRIGELKQMLKNELAPEFVQLVDVILASCGATRRTSSDLFGLSGDFISKSIQMGLKTVRGGGVVDNVFTQHKPLLAKILEDAKTGRLLESKYPSVTGSASAAPGPNANAPPYRDVIIFMVGGATYEEAAYVASVNAANPPAA